nr:hypothetical protein BaRGS_019876 [Batillaria attramentaria]
MKVSSPTVDSTTDSVVPDVLTSGEGDGGVLSQDSGVPSSSTAGDEDHTLHPWSITADQGVGDLEAFFSSAVDEGISAVFEIPSSTFESYAHKNKRKQYSPKRSVDAEEDWLEDATVRAHPGVHTSHISKIMGHAWRTMSPEEQAPYK